MSLAEKVRKRRIELGLTQDDLAHRMGYKSRVSINKIENGRPITQKIIVRLAKELYTTPSYLMGWQDEEEKGLDVLNVLTDEEKKKVINFANFLITQRK